jgi:hypothetical protein
MANQPPGGESLPCCVSSGIFNYLPLLQMALLEIGFLDLLLRFCHRQTNKTTHSPLSLTWHANSSLQRGWSMSNDHTTPDSLGLAILPPLSFHWRVGPQLQFIFNLRLLLLLLWAEFAVGRPPLAPKLVLAGLSPLGGVCRRPAPVRRRVSSDGAGGRAAQGRRDERAEEEADGARSVAALVLRGSGWLAPPHPPFQAVAFLLLRSWQ